MYKVSLYGIRDPHVSMVRYIVYRDTSRSEKRRIRFDLPKGPMLDIVCYHLEFLTSIFANNRRNTVWIVNTNNFFDPNDKNSAEDEKFPKLGMSQLRILHRS